MTQAKLLVAVIRHISLAWKKYQRLYRAFLNAMVPPNTAGNRAHHATLLELSHPVAARVNDQVPAVAHALSPQEPARRGAEADGRDHGPPAQPGALPLGPQSAKVSAFPSCNKRPTAHRPPVGASFIDAHGITDAEDPLREPPSPVGRASEPSR